jgi:prepilin-type N-terminal cleavage/methylation domain-containing protein
MKKGFTLIELVVVITIIGILSVFLVPKLLGVLDIAKEAGVKSIMHTVQLSIEAYNMENLSYPVASNITMKDLFDNYLSVGGYLAEDPKSPFTGKPYVENDTAGKIIYNYDSATGSYTLTGYKRDGVTEMLKLSNM